MKKILFYPAVLFELLWHTALPVLLPLHLFFGIWSWWAYLLLWSPAVMLAPIALLFMRKTEEKCYHDRAYRDTHHIQRYRLPRPAGWMETPDMHLPGALYEPTIYALYDRWLRGTKRLTRSDEVAEWVATFVTSWEWIGVRNVGQAILWRFGREVESMDDAELKTIKLNLIFMTRYIVYGSEVNTDDMLKWTKTGYWLVPGYFSFRKSPKGGA